MTAARFQKLGKRVNIVIFYGHNYTYGSSEGMWKVEVEFKDSGTQIKFERANHELNDALLQAYEYLDKIVVKGLGSSAMLPAIEHKQDTATTDDIPF